MRGRGVGSSETRFSFTRLRVFDLPENAFGSNVLASLGVQNAPNDPYTFGLPALVVTDYDTAQDSGYVAADAAR